MNESEKNIETCLPENILAEVASVPTDPQFVSLVNESLDPLKQQAVQQAGSDAYNEVVASHQPYTFTSQVAQMKSNLILLLRRFWRFPFGTGTTPSDAGSLRSLSDMWQHYITRLQGNETYGIPSRLSQLSDLPSAPLLVSDRKISGVPEAEDGISMANLIGSAARNDITEITDPNKGWTLNKSNIVSVLLGLFPALDKITLGMGKINNVPLAVGVTGISELNVPELVDVQGQYHSNGFIESLDIERFRAPKAKIWKSTGSTNSTDNGWFKNLADLEEIVIGDESDGVDFDFSIAGNTHSCFACKCSNLKKVVINSKRFCMALNWGRPLFYDTPIQELELGNLEYQYGHNMGSTSKLLKLSIKSANCNLDFAGWTPDSETLAHQDFLQNFRSFIVLRLANRKSTAALTLTLSAAVYNAVTGANSGWASLHTLADLGITDNDLTDLETELGITSATIYATWLDTYTGANGIHWDINKAN